MIKFKNLLGENNWKKEDVQRFLDVVKSEKWIVPQKNGVDLYRGTDNHVSFGIKKEYEEERKPKNTDPRIQKTIDIVTDIRYPNWPKRGRSRFSSTFLSEATRYGKPHYIFPEKSSKISSLPHDAYIAYFGSKTRTESIVRKLDGIQSRINKDLFSILRKQIGKEVSKIVKAYYTVFKDKQDPNYGFLKKLCEEMSLKKQIEKIKNIYENIESVKEVREFDYRSYLDLKDLLNDLHKNLIGHIKQYFVDGSLEIVDGSHEVIVQGDILHARKDFVDNFLSFDSAKNEWVLEEKFKSL